MAVEDVRTGRVLIRPAVARRERLRHAAAHARVERLEQRGRAAAVRIKGELRRRGRTNRRSRGRDHRAGRELANDDQDEMQAMERASDGARTTTTSAPSSSA